MAVQPYDWNLSGISGATAKQIVFGAADGSLTQSSKLSWDDAASTLTVTGRIVGVNVNGVTAASGTNLNMNGGDNGGGVSVTGSTGASVSGKGGSFTANGGSGGAPNGDGGDVNFNSGSPQGSGFGGAIIFQAATVTNNDGSILIFTATDGVGTNKNGGDMYFTFGSPTGAGAKGRFQITNSLANYAEPNGTGTVTISNLRPSAVSTATIAGWLPITIDGTLSYLPFWR